MPVLLKFYAHDDDKHFKEHTCTNLKKVSEARVDYTSNEVRLTKLNTVKIAQKSIIVKIYAVYI